MGIMLYLSKQFVEKTYNMHIVLTKNFKVEFFFHQKLEKKNRLLGTFLILRVKCYREVHDKLKILE